jgi:hypothetical protein
MTDLSSFDDDDNNKVGISATNLYNGLLGLIDEVASN